MPIATASFSPDGQILIPGGFEGYLILQACHFRPDGHELHIAEAVEKNPQPRCPSRVFVIARVAIFEIRGISLLQGQKVPKRSVREQGNFQR
jgi:hypothetical protein